ncbi:unnamed protein product [Protopolystoma xenopodis]|uniref:Uncharacterized protein n=1 Tax=Protopolystoma xenopodis TaxID=117903 RepID=A0A448XKK0_9PLAT|nr:unnamed protein product [Protopolystoma xenopodis]
MPNSRLHPCGAIYQLRPAENTSLTPEFQYPRFPSPSTPHKLIITQLSCSYRTDTSPRFFSSYYTPTSSLASQYSPLSSQTYFPFSSNFSNTFFASFAFLSSSSLTFVDVAEKIPYISHFASYTASPSVWTPTSDQFVTHSTLDLSALRRKETGNSAKSEPVNAISEGNIDALINSVRRLMIYRTDQPIRTSRRGEKMQIGLGKDDTSLLAGQFDHEASRRRRSTLPLKAWSGHQKLNNVRTGIAQSPLTWAIFGAGDDQTENQLLGDLSVTIEASMSRQRLRRIRRSRRGTQYDLLPILSFLY